MREGYGAVEDLKFCHVFGGFYPTISAKKPAQPTVLESSSRSR